MKLRKTHQQFVDQANKIHENKYSYPEMYAGDSVKITIICPIHYSFKQIPSSHLRGCGCPQCAIEYRASLFVKNNDAFVIQADAVHNNKYNYPEEYRGSKTKIKIECHIHGVFLQKPDKHLQGNGCAKCAGNFKKNTEQFIDEANLIHKCKYTYPGEYVNARTNIEIKCYKHGVFKQVPDVHLNGHGCPSCATNVSKMETEWLDSLGIPNDNAHRSLRIKIGDSYIKPDGFDSAINTIYEFYGDYFHGNVNVYDATKINHKNNKTLGELYQKTIEREALIKQAGYNIVSIWENDWKRIINEPRNTEKVD